MWFLTSGKLEILGNSDRYYVFVLGRKKVSLLVVFWIGFFLSCILHHRNIKVEYETYQVLQDFC